MNENNAFDILHAQLDPEKRSVVTEEIKPKPDGASPQPIRTYESDVAEALKRKGSSAMTIAIAENERETGEEKIADKPPSQAGKKIFILLLSLIFIGAGIAGGYYLYLKSPLVGDPKAEPIIKLPSIVTPDVQLSIPIENISSILASSTADAGKITEYIPTHNVGSTTARVTGSEFREIMSFDMTDTLKRALTDKWMWGKYENSTFIIFNTDFFQNAFAGMLKWEQTMPEELASPLGYEYSPGGRFIDKIIKNRDTRQYMTPNGEILFLYSFIDKNTIIIAANESIIPVILERIEKQTYIR
ncbi:MAG TPA: hypothetical protein VJI66_02860 [Candidatus Paceibacterota bacterium]